MAIPYEISAFDLCREALARAGKPRAKPEQVNDAVLHQLQEVKTDIQLLAPRHPLLQVAVSEMAVKGRQEYFLPANAHTVQGVTAYSFMLNGERTATGFDGVSLEVDEAFPFDVRELVGLWIFVLAPNWAKAQIIGYDSGFRMLSLDRYFGVQPAGTFPYKIAASRCALTLIDDHRDMNSTELLLRPPRGYSMNNQSMSLDAPPDATYGLVWDYNVDLDTLDTGDAKFKRIFREWRSVFMQGVVAKLMQRYDDARYPTEMQIYQNMLLVLETESCRILPITFRD